MMRNRWEMPILALRRMSRRQRKLLAAALCLLLTAAHFAYACYAYEHASIIQFIARELW